MTRSTHHLSDQLLESLQVVGDAIGVGAQGLPRDVVELVERQLAECRGLIAGLCVDSAGSAERRVPASGVCDLLHEVQQVIQANDATFLQRHLTHDLRSTRDLPHVCVSPEQVRMVAGELLAYALQIAAKGSLVTVELKEVPLKQGVGIACSTMVSSPDFSERDRYRLFEEFSAGAPHHPHTFAFALCREVLDGVHGQVWIEIPTKGKVALTFVIPCVREVPVAESIGRVKCDIVIGNYAALQAAHGLAKATQMVRQMEQCLRHLVRYPLDAVAAFESRGVVSTIMELPLDRTDVVIGRLRHAFDREPFHAGRDPVRLELDYQLTTLP